MPRVFLTYVEETFGRHLTVFAGQYLLDQFIGYVVRVCYKEFENIYIPMQGFLLKSSGYELAFEWVHRAYDLHIRDEGDDMLMIPTIPIKCLKKRQHEILWDYCVQNFGKKWLRVFDLYPFIEYIVFSLLLPDYLKNFS